MRGPLCGRSVISPEPRVDPGMWHVPATRASPVGSTGRGVSPDALCTWVHTVAPWGWSSRPHRQAEETRRQRVKLPAQWDLENPTALGELTSC